MGYRRYNCIVKYNPSCKNRTEKPGCIVIQVEESEEIIFEEFDRTMTKNVRKNGLEENPYKDKRNGR
ncbi:hypothetical protein HMF3257_14375 [Spirosoma telluris]|uniref:Uncharacterized protein n=1 Tax=Spirosoma telluris TaxID=2183553 RepID=A0A327NI85_9BACT|nr:hypothetical protein HMF3257_14375 [Spirosoma telluris]